MTDPYLQHLLDHLDGDRANDPGGYIRWMGTWPRFADGFLQRVPKKAVILHDTRIEEHLAIIGTSARHQRVVRTGTTDPNLLYVIFNNDGSPALMINRGLPGGGGVTTQAAELYALGVDEIVHIGTCALMGDDVPPKRIVLATGAYKDGAAVLLSGTNDRGLVTPVACPDADLSDRLEKALETAGAAVSRSCGYTIGSFYFQPVSLMKQLVLNQDLPGPQDVGHVEMEEAGLFTVAARMGRKAASLVVGSDRYTVVDGKLEHAFEDDFDQDEAERTMLRAAASAMGVALV